MTQQNTAIDPTSVWALHLDMARRVVKAHCYHKDLTEDALQEVKLALWEATQNWNAEMEDAFSYYAWVAMKRRLFAYLTTKAFDRPKVSKQERDAIKQAREMLAGGSVLTCAQIDALSLSSNIGRFRLTQILSIWLSSSLSLTATSVELFSELSVPDPTAVDECPVQKIHEALGSLNERERAIIQARYLRDPRVTLAVLAKEQSVSIERIRQVEVAALKKMRAALAQFNL